MNFASALISLHSGYKIRRKHWTGYWQLEDGEVFIYTYDGKKLNIRASENIMYTISNMACNDWEIASLLDNIKGIAEIDEVKEKISVLSEKLY